ncbi:Hypothetical predicted protein [Cloeon dipterum]|uniref:Beta-glucuronidase n=1 Tax=Cloeon dipterum TaxID=197152 RepID=A0A8S1CC60_9INSE|nr:Hypothetical predicted protein [Cloeon dipterum]
MNDPEVGMREKWWKKLRLGGGDVILMPVPSSYNDITQETRIRDHIGVVWYQKCGYLPERVTNRSRRVVLHFGSVNYRSVVWVNDVKVTENIGGHLPFEMEVTDLRKAGKICVTVAVNNTLTPNSIPQGKVVHYKDRQKYPEGFVTQRLNFDFFHYAGIHRSVNFYTTPFAYFTDVTVLTDVDFSSDAPIGIINFEIEFDGQTASDTFRYNVILLDENGKEVANSMSNTKLSGEMKVENPKLWWPYLSQSEEKYAYLYTLQFQLIPENDIAPQDIYNMKVGIRSLEWDQSMQNTLLINNKPLYIRGFGRHEDADIRGRGFDLAIALRDAYLMQWIGANGYRTSHYPYSEESLDIADQFGFVVIDETPAIGLSNFTNRLQKKHLKVTTELIARDKNHPSVIIWSLSNEPLTQLPTADEYFKELVQNVSMLDATRPVTFVTSQQWNNDVAVQHMDIVCVNRYAGWYGDEGHIELIERQTISEVKNWYTKFGKPVILSEYGAGALSGFHSLPSAMWTEEFEAQTLFKHFSAFDKLYGWDMLMGEMVWNFADFMTPQETIRPTGCMKGVFTRNRQPKLAAYILRQRYWQLAHKHCSSNFKGGNIAGKMCSVKLREFKNLFEQSK